MSVVGLLQLFASGVLITMMSVTMLMPIFNVGGALVLPISHPRAMDIHKHDPVPHPSDPHRFTYHNRVEGSGPGTYALLKYDVRVKEGVVSLDKYTDTITSVDCSLAASTVTVTFNANVSPQIVSSIANATIITSSIVGETGANSHCFNETNTSEIGSVYYFTVQAQPQHAYDPHASSSSSSFTQANSLRFTSSRVQFHDCFVSANISWHHIPYSLNKTVRMSDDITIKAGASISNTTNEGDGSTNYSFSAADDDDDSTNNSSSVSRRAAKSCFISDKLSRAGASDFQSDDSCSYSRNLVCEDASFGGAPKCSPGTDKTDCDRAKAFVHGVSRDGQCPCLSLCSDDGFCHVDGETCLESGLIVGDRGPFGIDFRVACVSTFNSWYQQLNSPKDSCKHAVDGKCDEAGSCPASTDSTDCRPYVDVSNACSLAGNTVCEESQHGGTGACNDGEDTSDCEQVTKLANVQVTASGCPCLSVCAKDNPSSSDPTTFCAIELGCGTSWKVCTFRDNQQYTCEACESQSEKKFVEDDTSQFSMDFVKTFELFSHRVPDGEMVMSCQNCGVRVGIGFVFEFNLGWSGVTFEIGFKGEFTPSMTLQASMSGDVAWKREKPVPFINALLRSLNTAMASAIGPVSLAIKPEFGLNYRLEAAVSGTGNAVYGIATPTTFEYSVKYTSKKGLKPVVKHSSSVNEIGPMVNAEGKASLRFSLVPYFQLVFISILKLKFGIVPWIEANLVGKGQIGWDSNRKFDATGDMCLGIEFGLDFEVTFSIDIWIWKKTWKLAALAIVDDMCLLKKCIKTGGGDDDDDNAISLIDGVGVNKPLSSSRKNLRVLIKNGAGFPKTHAIDSFYMRVTAYNSDGESGARRSQKLKFRAPNWHEYLEFPTANYTYIVVDVLRLTESSSSDVYVRLGRRVIYTTLAIQYEDLIIPTYPGWAAFSYTLSTVYCDEAHIVNAKECSAFCSVSTQVGYWRSRNVGVLGSRTGPSWETSCVCVIDTDHPNFVCNGTTPRIVTQCVSNITALTRGSVLYYTSIDYPYGYAVFMCDYGYDLFGAMYSVCTDSNWVAWGDEPKCVPSPTPSPTSFPTDSPTDSPSPFPTFSPTPSPTPFPTAFPTASDSIASSGTAASTDTPVVVGVVVPLVLLLMIAVVVVVVVRRRRASERVVIVAPLATPNVVNPLYRIDISTSDTDPGDEHHDGSPVTTSTLPPLPSPLTTTTTPQPPPALMMTTPTPTATTTTPATTNGDDSFDGFDDVKTADA